MVQVQQGAGLVELVGEADTQREQRVQILWRGLGLGLKLGLGLGLGIGLGIGIGLGLGVQLKLRWSRGCYGGDVDVTAAAVTWGSEETARRRLAMACWSSSESAWAWPRVCHAIESSGCCWTAASRASTACGAAIDCAA